MFHKRLYKPFFPEKYAGDPTNIVMRSSWETKFALWCDNNPHVVKWSSEETIVPYRCPTDGKVHRYFIDFKITFNNKKTYLVELKPKKQTVPPEQKSTKKRARKQYITEVLAYVKNQAKWKAADAYAKSTGTEFQVWTEDTLDQLGIKILGK